jgi:protein SCO1/2
MRTTIHIALILLLGVGLGLAFRAFRPLPTDGPGPDDIIYDNSLGIDEAAIENRTPSHPPEDEEWLSKFELTERSGEIVKSGDLLGQPYVVSFFFSTCPSICVQQNQKLKELQDEFADQGVRFVAISVDPETDTPERLREYAARFGADKDQWLFMTGDLTYIRRIGAEIYQQPVDKKFHSERFVLVDSQGAIEGFYSWPEQVQFQKLQERISQMLAGESS